MISSLAVSRLFPYHQEACYGRSVVPYLASFPSGLSPYNVPWTHAAQSLAHSGGRANSTTMRKRSEMYP
jgi:hypothetical protein